MQAIMRVRLNGLELAKPPEPGASNITGGRKDAGPRPQEATLHRLVRAVT